MSKFCLYQLQYQGTGLLSSRFILQRLIAKIIDVYVSELPHFQVIKKWIIRRMVSTEN